MSAFRPQPNLAFADPDRQAAAQDRLLRRHLAWCLHASPFYRQQWAAAGLTARDLSAVALADLPATTKADLERANDLFLAVPPWRVVDIVQSSGTTGRPTRIMYTERDLVRLAYNERQAFRACGITAADVALLTCTLDRCFIAGLAYYQGLRSLGAACVRNGHGSMENHLDVLQRLRPTLIVGVPTFLRKLGHAVQAAGGLEGGPSVRRLVCIGEPIRDRDLGLNALGRDLRALWSAQLHSTYATSETISTFCECEAGRGGHLSPDLAVVEILDERGRPLPPGRAGEVTFTPLQIEGMPLVRFRTGDVSFLEDRPCPCGRRGPRLGPILGRLQHMLKVRGTTLYPQAIFSVLDGLPAVQDYYVEVRPGADLADEVTVHVALAGRTCTAAEVRRRLQAALRVAPAVVVKPVAVVRGVVYSPHSRKPVRVIDYRGRGT